MRRISLEEVNKAAAQYGLSRGDAARALRHQHIIDQIEEIRRAEDAKVVLRMLAREVLRGLPK